MNPHRRTTPWTRPVDPNFAPTCAPKPATNTKNSHQDKADICWRTIGQTFRRRFRRIPDRYPNCAKCPSNWRPEASANLYKHLGFYTVLQFGELFGTLFGAQFGALFGAQFGAHFRRIFPAHIFGASFRRTSLVQNGPTLPAPISSARSQHAFQVHLSGTLVWHILLDVLPEM